MKDSTGDDVREGVRVSAADEVDLPGSRGSAHFALKWARDARHAAHLTLAPVKGVTRAYTGADDGTWVGVVGMECRGLEPVSWQPEVRPHGQAACGGTKCELCIESAHCWLPGWDKPHAGQALSCVPAQAAGGDVRGCARCHWKFGMHACMKRPLVPLHMCDSKQTMGMGHLMPHIAAN